MLSRFLCHVEVKKPDELHNKGSSRYKILSIDFTDDPPTSTEDAPRIGARMIKEGVDANYHILLTLTLIIEATNKEDAAKKVIDFITKPGNYRKNIEATKLKNLKLNNDQKDNGPGL